MNSDLLIDRCILARFCGEARTHLAQSGPVFLRSAANPIDDVPSAEPFATFSLPPTSPHPSDNSAFTRDRWVDNRSNLAQLLLSEVGLDQKDWTGSKRLGWILKIGLRVQMQ